MTRSTGLIRRDSNHLDQVWTNLPLKYQVHLVLNGVGPKPPGAGDLESGCLIPRYVVERTEKVGSPVHLGTVQANIGTEMTD
jgi:hypothetical protein